MPETKPAPASVRVRFAPSPTGWVHVGGLRTALYNYLFARKHGGDFLLRIEDTDQERFVEGAEEAIFAALDWAGLQYDEGPGVGGPVGPYRQSERAERYRHYADRLIEAGHAYYAFDTREELEALRRQEGVFPASTYNAASRMVMQNGLTLSAAEVQERLDAGESYVIRLKVPSGETVRFEDLVRGPVAIDTAEVDDQVLVKSDGLPTYHLANVVDDHLMQITHVIRGEEWLPSTPKHVLLYRYLGWEPPKMAHLPLILSPTGGKLSKRRGEEQGIPVSVEHYREQGYEPAALVNFLAFLGWNPGTEQEVFTLDELVAAFSLERVGSAGVQFNLEKLAWYNQQFIRRMTPAELAARARPHLRQAGFDPDEAYLERVAALLQERTGKVEDLARAARFFFEDPAAYEAQGVEKRWKDDSPALLSAYADRLAALNAFDEEAVEGALRALAEERGAGAGRIIHPTRLAVSGLSFGPGLFEMMTVLGRDACIRRIRRAVAVLG